VSFLAHGRCRARRRKQHHTSGYNLRNTVLKVVHHGKSHVTGQAFSNIVKLSIRIAGIGAGNDYVHENPSPVT
jgi:beta-lactamase superfamily II metal-dependent hydrolase